MVRDYSWWDAYAIYKKEILTTDRLASLEDLSYFRIHIDHHVLLGFDLVVTLPHLGLDPLGKDIATDCVDNVCYILSW